MRWMNCLFGEKISLFGSDREFARSALGLLIELTTAGAPKGRKCANSLIFSLLAGNSATRADEMRRGQFPDCTLREKAAAAIRGGLVRRSAYDLAAVLALWLLWELL